MSSANTHIVAPVASADGSGLPPEAFAAALAELPGMWPARLARLLSRYEPQPAWHAIRRGSVSDEVLEPQGGETKLRDAMRKQARAIDVHGRWRVYRQARVGVALCGGPGYPAALVDDPAPPAVLFWHGNPDVVEGPRVGIIGTRRCSRYGLDLAHEFGAQLASEGVRVVSGLALGIDGAAHRGALSVAGAAPIGVVGSGLDVVYPKAHRGLWGEVAERGVLFSEASLGARPESWRFPQRNRIIAALCDVLVVVESGVRGGSLLTVRDAFDRNRTVMAVPGPVRADTSVGTNRLLADGVQPALDVTDVFVALGLSPGGNRSDRETRQQPSDAGTAVLDEIGWQPISLDSLLARSPLPLPKVVAEVERLTRFGWVVQRDGWIERVALRGGAGG